MKIALIIGTGIFGEDVLHKIPWIRHLKNDYFIASRINPEVHLNCHSEYILGSSHNEIVNSIKELRKISKKYLIIYESNYFRKKYEKNQIYSLEKWLGISFSYISSFDRRFYNAEKRVDNRNPEDLLEYIARLVDFFRTFFVENEVEVFINTIEDDAVSVVAYYVAKKLSIRIIGFMPSRFPEKGVIFCEDFKNICVFNEEKVEYKKIESLYNKTTIAGANNLEKNKNYWKLKSFVRRFKGIYFMWKNKIYINNILKNYESEKFIIKKISFFNEIRQYLVKLIRYLLVKRILKPQSENNYFLFPLHYLDDAQITFREPLLEQFNLIYNISRSLPEDCFLYVKPHPHYLGTDVSIKNLIKIKKLKNVKIINPLVPPLNLIKKSLGVITINSTTGFEAIIMGIPVITFGHDFYCKDSCCHVIRDLNLLSGTLLNILNNIEFKESKKFVKEVYNNTIWVSNSEFENIFALNENDGKKISEALKIILKN